MKITGFKYGLVTQDNIQADVMDGIALSGVDRTVYEGRIWKPVARAKTVALTSPFTIHSGTKMIAGIYKSSAHTTTAGLETQGIGKRMSNKVGLRFWITGYTVTQSAFPNPTYALSGASRHTYGLEIIGY